MSREEQLEALEAIIQRQRLQMFFQSRLWLEEREENVRLREIILELRERLLEAGLPSDLPFKKESGIENYESPSAQSPPQ